MCPKDADAMVNSDYSYSLIWVYTVCPDPQYVRRFKEHSRMYGQRHGRKSHAPEVNKFYSCYLIELQLLYEIFQEICQWDHIQRIFLHKKMYNCGRRIYSCVH